MAKPELVIFDCDGVLVDSERIAIRLNIELLAEYGHHATEADIVDHFVGKSLPSIQELIAEWLGRPVPEWPDLWMTRMTAAHDAELTAVDGIAEALDRIDLPVCVASSGRLEKTRHSLKLTGLSHHFGDRLFSSTMVERGKPFPDLFLHAARTLGVEPTACVVVEDSEPGVRAARSAGMRCFAYAGGVTSGEKLIGDGTVVFDDMRRLPELLAAS
ncbi:HAD superfamily hydrolase (TIGR01509 family) [Hamadaea flava]|uniref:HAD family hydrolase n=1 Tax=Hamadaea flava TaxID=1742688 RepID=A0ABV8LPD8_9ACTN|nr:HAD family hydrolase [Hamadaea flava]MCP2322504.1 HAD superfamily hydrolase (TIGR01509 family) [Hamadaea flava]